jgi:hypothetical protein
MYKTPCVAIPPCSGRHVKPLVLAAFVVVSTYQSALGPRRLWPVPLCVIYKEGLCPSSEDISGGRPLVGDVWWWTLGMFNYFCSQRPPQVDVATKTNKLTRRPLVGDVLVVDVGNNPNFP